MKKKWKVLYLNKIKYEGKKLDSVLWIFSFHNPSIMPGNVVGGIMPANMLGIKKLILIF